MGDNFGIHRAAPGAQSARASSGNVAAADDRTQGQVLSDFLLQLEDYTPTVIQFVYFFSELQSRYC